MPLKQIIRSLHKNHKKSVKDNLAWFDDRLNDKKSNEVVRVAGNKDLKPGKLYRFYYHPKATLRTIPFFDAYPLIISLGTQKFGNKKLDLGINLNYFPYDVKVHIINTIYKTYKNIIETQRRLHPLDANLQLHYDIDYDELLMLFKKYNIPFAIRNYRKENRLNTYCISYDNFFRLPFIDSAKFNKKNAQQIFSFYYKSLKK